MARSAKIFYNFALIFLKTAGNYDFSHILAELTAYFFPVFEKSLFLPPRGVETDHLTTLYNRKYSGRQPDFSGFFKNREEIS